MTTLRNWIDTVFFGVRWLYTAGTELAQRNAVNFASPISAVDNPTTKATDISVPIASSEGAGLLPATVAANEVLCTDADGDPEWTSVLNAHVDPAAAIAGTKIAPNFGAQNIVTTGSATVGSLAATGAVTAASSSVTGTAAAATVTASTAVAVGATPASSGALRLASAAALRARNAGNAENIEIVSTDGSDDIHVGATANAASSIYLDVATGEVARVRVNGAVVLEVDGTGATVTGELDASSILARAIYAAEGDDIDVSLESACKLRVEVDGVGAFEVSGYGVAEPFAHVDANVVLTTDNLATDATGLSLALDAGIWEIEGRYHFTGNSADNAKFDYTFSGTLGNVEGLVVIYDVEGAAAVTPSRRTAVTTSTTVTMGGDDNIVTERTTLEVTGAGTLLFRAAKAFDFAGDNSLAEGSILRARKRITP